MSAVRSRPRAEGFAMPIAYCERHPVAEVCYRFVPDLKTLAEESDALVVAVSGGAATHNLMNRPVLDALGLAGILINGAHGGIVDEAALVTALAEGSLRGAGLDVFAHEPEVPKALRAMGEPDAGPARHRRHGRRCEHAIETKARVRWRGQS
jgi:hydroxypyruvate reductase